MKKLIVALFAAILTTAGLVAVSSAPASAGCTQYVCNATKPAITGKTVVKKGQKAKINVKVETKGGGNVKASGKVKVKITGPGGFTRTITATYDGKKVSFKLGKLNKPGVYKVKVKFNGGRGFENSERNTKIVVLKKR